MTQDASEESDLLRDLDIQNTMYPRHGERNCFQTSSKKALQSEKSAVSIKFPPVILGPEMAAPILWAPGIFGSFCWKTAMQIKFLLFWGVPGFFRRGGVEVPSLFLWRGDFSDNSVTAMVNFRNPEKGAFARGALHKFVAICAPNYRIIAGISYIRGRVRNFGGENVYTKGVSSSETSSASTGKEEVWYIPKSLFSGEKKGKKKKHVHQRAFQACVGDLFAQHWCIDFGLL